MLKKLTGTIVEIKLDLETATFETLAIGIEEKEGIPPAKQRLMFNQKVHPLETKLKDAGVTDKSIVFLVLKLK